MKEKALKLALAIYRLTNLFPEGEVIIGQLRKNANQLVEEVILNHKEEATTQIEIIFNFLYLAQAQSWAREINFLLLKKEYQNLLIELREAQEQKEIFKKLKSQAKISADQVDLNLRQKKILEKAKNFKRFSVQDVLKDFSDVSRKTINRDLDELCQLGLIENFGQSRARFYQMIKKER